ncbi:DeoR/GlpR family DNA-binding transcription regulator [Leucobacter luti]|uniref:DeoR family transcriptional regulator n=1 Tax=Leucobacter luti TaxID=340320 RepID=A0A4Q7U0S8_9MICO|nr:DeoR/GlpR family DNA-binding transcription regulator [Leucobacter luti]MBL3699333.1 DeoR/GlpR transcriptional regulator [Leucobacter luti]RZT66843.1 DeoR family transcriptional regulator [Leucobacter luti]
MARAAEPRDERILALLEGQERVAVGVLSARLGVSEVTIRKDLDRLARSSLVERIRGGARLRAGEEGALSVRLGHRVAAKRAVAKRAAELVSPDAVIALDSSSTGYYLALELAERDDITVVTNSLRVATQLAEHSSIELVLLGGTVRRTSSSTVGFPVELLQGFGRIDIAFLGVSALSAEQGLLERAFSEAETKRMVASVSDRVVGLFDSSKAAGFGQHGVVPPGDVERLITDEAFSAAEVEKWRALGVTVERVAIPEH